MEGLRGIIENLFVRALARGLALCCLFILPIQSSQATVHICQLADGSITFQDSTCPVVKNTVDKPVTAAARIPFGMEETWFDQPPVVPDRAVCTKTGCHCDMYSRKYKGGLGLAIADALYLDGSWHRLELTLSQLELPDNTSAQRSNLRKERDEAACNILMSQKTLRLFGDEVLHELRDKKRYAEERGYDNPEDCDAGDFVVCEYTDAITLYDRIQTDIKSLSRAARVTDNSASDNADLLKPQSEFAESDVR